MPDEMAHEQRNVFRALTQSRHLNGKNIQPVVEVATKVILCHHPFQVAMGRNHQPSVDFRRPCAPQAFEFPLLQDAQQFRLELQGDITDFVQKQRTMVRQLQPATLLCDRAREGTPLMPKEFALQQTAGNGSTVELDQRAIECGDFLLGNCRLQIRLKAATAPAKVQAGLSKEFGVGFNQTGGIMCPFRYSRYIVLPLMLLLPAMLVAQSQATTGTIEGTTLDQTGAVLPGVTVTVRNSATGAERTVTSDEKGYFRAPLLPPGSYQVTAELGGFARLQQTGLTLNIGQTVNFSLKLQVAGGSETVTVSGEGPVVET